MIQIYNADCLEKMKDISDKSIDMILCDLPYGTTACKWDTIIPFDKLWEQYNRVIKDRGAIVLFGSEPFSSYLRMSNIKNYKYDWVWDKKKAGNPLLSKIMPLKTFENIMVFERKGKKINYYPIMEKRDNPKSRGKNNRTVSEITGKAFTENKVYTHRYPKAILEFSNASQKGRLHPTQKPVALCRYLIRTYTNENDLVLDNCMGSGSTGMACIEENRRFIGIEKDKEIFDTASNRLNIII